MTKALTESIIYIIIFFFVLFLALYRDEKKTKDGLAKFYNITRPTLSKWIKYFQCEESIDEWNKKRFISTSDETRLKQEFGYDGEMVLSKKQLADKATSNYKTVAENVKINLDKIGISLEAWESCNVFPPEVCKKILCVLS